MSKKKLLVATVLLSSPLAFAGTTTGDATGTTTDPTNGGVESAVQLTGNVPEIFKVTSRGIPSDLDFSQAADVKNRVLGVYAFEYNVRIGSLRLYTANTSGAPENKDGVKIDLGQEIEYHFTCTNSNLPTIDTSKTITRSALQTAAAAGVDIRGAGGNLSTGTGVKDECTLYGTWQGNPNAMPLSGVYSDKLTLVMKQ